MQCHACHGVTTVTLLSRVTVTAESLLRSRIEDCCHVCHACHSVDTCMRTSVCAFGIDLRCFVQRRMSFRSLGLLLPVSVMRMDESGKKSGDFLRSAPSVIGGE